MAKQSEAGVTEKVEGLSADIKEERLCALQQLLPETFTEGKLDAEKLKTLFAGEKLAGNEDGERYRLEWAGKRLVFDEIARRTSCTLTLDTDRSSEDFETSQNTFIEGENLEVLRMLQKAYHGKVKMIYIDPPYNTGKDFVYNDNFRQTEAEYCEDTCNLDEDGNLKRAYKQNSKDSGRFHSNWLSMMYPRLFLARNLLRDDGVIFVSIDDNEVHNLRGIMNEIFGEENFVAQVVWERAYSPVNLKRYFSESHDYILIYAKSLHFLPSLSLSRSEEATARYSNPDNDPRGLWQSSDISVGPAVVANIYEIESPSGRKVLPSKGRSWVYSKEKFEDLKRDNRIWFGDDGSNFPRLKRFLSDVKEGVTPMTLWKYDEVGHSQDATRQLKELFDGNVYFDYPKPVSLIKRCLNLATSDSDIVLDFFSGSATTAHAVMEQNAEDGGNRQYICVQMPEETPPDSEARQAGYSKISDIAIDRIKKAAIKIKKEHPEYSGDLGVRVYRETDSNFPQWHARAFETDSELTVSLLEYAKRMPSGDEQARATEVLLKLGYPLTTTLEEKNGFLLADNTVALVLQDTFKAVGLSKVLDTKPHTVVVLERIFVDDTEKINFALRCKEEKIIFQTI